MPCLPDLRGPERTASTGSLALHLSSMIWRSSRALVKLSFSGISIRMAWAVPAKRLTGSPVSYSCGTDGGVALKSVAESDGDVAFKSVTETDGVLRLGLRDLSLTYGSDSSSVTQA